MLTTKIITFAAAAFAIATTSQVAQAKEFKEKHEMWDGKTIVQNASAGVTVTDGKISITDARIISAKPTDPTTQLTDDEIKNSKTSSGTTLDNVKRIKSILGTDIDTEVTWKAAFPKIENSTAYSYKNFLKAAAKYPHFCNETNFKSYDSHIHSKTEEKFDEMTKDDQLTYSLDQTCRHELATLFAHWSQETGWNNATIAEPTETWQQALYYTKEWGCHYDKESEWKAHCKTDYRSGSTSWATSAFPSVDGQYYFGRGPLQLSWNYNYGAFSQLFHSNDYDSKDHYLNHPGDVITDDGKLMDFMMWFYMTPQPPKPCMHSIATGFYEPNETDKAANFRSNFGTTINIINGDLECNTDSYPVSNDEEIEKKEETEKKSAQRVKYYKKWLDYMNLPENNDTDLKCSDQPTKFLWKGSAGSRYMYFSKAANGWDNRCGITMYPTQYSVVNDNDYKRCVCDSFGKGEADCMTE